MCLLLKKYSKESDRVIGIPEVGVGIRMSFLDGFGVEHFIPTLQLYLRDYSVIVYMHCDRQSNI